MLFWLFSGGAALVYWMLSLGEGQGWLRTVVKGLAVVPLAVMAGVQGAPLLALALGLCSLGDVALSRPGQRAFLSGLIAFAMGHVAWITVFLLYFDPKADLLTEVPRLSLLVILCWHTVSFGRKLIPQAGALKGPVAVYTLIIACMGLAALITPSTLIIVGAALFIISDTLLGLQMFVLTPGTINERMAKALIWPLYWAAIACLTLAILP